MQVKTSKEVTDRQKAGNFVLWVFRIHGDGVATSVDERLGPGLEGSDESGPHAQLRASTLTLQRGLGKLVGADVGHYDEKAALAALIKTRNQNVLDLTRYIVSLRRIVLGQHDEVDLDRFGFGGEAARDGGVPLLRQGQRLVRTLESEDLSEILGQPVFASSVFDAKLYLADLRAGTAALAGVLDKIGEAQRKVEKAFLRKKECTKLYDRVFGREVRGFTDWCHLVGREDLAVRVRPSVTRRGRTEQEPPDLSSEDGATVSADLIL
jgi:hypothetical protein